MSNYADLAISEVTQEIMRLHPCNCNIDNMRKSHDGLRVLLEFEGAPSAIVATGATIRNTDQARAFYNTNANWKPPVMSLG